MKVGPLFVSHASEDRDLASHVLSYLESRGQKCWMAPRDIRPADDWAESIIDGIDAASGMVLLLSRHSNESPQVRRELERAVSRGVKIYPLFVESIELSKWMQYYISPHQWHDASDVSMGRKLEELLEAIRDFRSSEDMERDLDALSALLADDLASLSAVLDVAENESERLLSGERKKVSVLHVMAVLSDREVQCSIRTTVYRTLDNLVERYARFYDGYLERLPFTGYRCVFGLEQVQEDDDRRALSCGICLLNGFNELNSILRRKNLKVDFGLGIASGMVWVESTEENASATHGEALLSAQDLADEVSGHLLVTGDFYRSNRENCVWEEHSAGVYRVTDSRAAFPGTRVVSINTPFVGREKEISRLESLLVQQAGGMEKNTLGGVKHLYMAIRGEAGIGKSRLVHEFIAKHRSGEGFLVLRGQTLSFAQPPCWAWTTLLRNLMGVQHGSDTDYDQFRPGSKALASMKTSRTRRLSLPHCFP